MLRPSALIRTKDLAFQDHPIAVGIVTMTDQRSKVKRRKFWVNRSFYSAHYLGFLLLLATVIFAGIVFRSSTFHGIDWNVLGLRRVTDVFHGKATRYRNTNDGTIRLSQKYTEFVPKIRKHQG